MTKRKSKRRKTAEALLGMVVTRKRKGRGVKTRKTGAGSSAVEITSGTFTDRLLARAEARFAPLLPPWGVLVLLLLVAVGAHHMWRDWAAKAPAVAAILVIGTGLTAMTWLISRERSSVARTHGAGSMLAATLWLALATVTGPVDRPTIDVFVLGGAGLAISWNLRYAIRSDEADKFTAGWDELAEKLRLSGSKWRTKHQSEHQAQGKVQLVGGEQTPSDLTRQKDKIAGYYRLPPGAVRINPNPSDSSEVDVTLQFKDMLKQPTPWPGPVNAGKSIGHAPVHLGVYSDGTVAKLHLPETHVMIMGMTGSGKSVGARVILADLFSRPDVEVRAADTVKGEQTLGCAREGLSTFATTKTSADYLLDQLETEITDRANQLAERGLDKWEPGCGLNYLVVLLEEAARLVPDSGTFTSLMQGTRSVGISIIGSWQRATYRAVDPDARAQFGSAICFGVQSEDDAAFALPEETIEGGANPAKWGQRAPGYTYLVAPGVDESRHTEPMRFYNIDRGQVADAAQKPQPDSSDAPQGQEAATGGAPEAQQASIITGADPNPDIQASLDDDLDHPGEPTMELPQPDRDMSTEQARDTLAERLDMWEREGLLEFGPRDLYDLLARVSRSRSWIHHELRRLEGSGRIEQTEQGPYRIRPVALNGGRAAEQQTG